MIACVACGILPARSNRRCDTCRKYYLVKGVDRPWLPLTKGQWTKSKRCPQCGVVGSRKRLGSCQTCYNKMRRLIKRAALAKAAGLSDRQSARKTASGGSPS